MQLIKFLNLNKILKAMLVPSMTIDEIRKEIARDLPILKSKVDHLEHKLRRATRPHGNDKVVRFYDYVSKYKNNWIFRIVVMRRQMEATLLVYYYTNIGLVGIITAVNDDFLVYHTSHFFKRYNERLGLSLKTPNEIMKAFINECYEFAANRMKKLSPGIYHVFCASNTGYCLGVENEDKHFIIMNTFISQQMLKGNQLPLAERLNKEMEMIDKNCLDTW
jgi:hypothetical protein